jgi:hypothetical protein
VAPIVEKSTVEVEVEVEVLTVRGEAEPAELLLRGDLNLALLRGPTDDITAPAPAAPAPTIIDPMVAVPVAVRVPEVVPEVVGVAPLFVVGI